MEGIDRGIADEDVDLAEFRLCLFHEGLQLVLVVDVAGNRNGAIVASRPFLVDLGRDFVAGYLLARGDDDISAVLRHALGNSLADTFGRAGDNGGLAVEIE